MEGVLANIPVGSLLQVSVGGQGGRPKGGWNGGGNGGNQNAGGGGGATDVRFNGTALANRILVAGGGGGGGRAGCEVSGGAGGAGGGGGQAGAAGGDTPTVNGGIAGGGRGGNLGGVIGAGGSAGIGCATPGLAGVNGALGLGGNGGNGPSVGCFNSGTVSGGGGGGGSSGVNATHITSAFINPNPGQAASGVVQFTYCRALPNQAPLTVTATPATIAINGTSTLGTSGGSGTGAVAYALIAGFSSCSLSGSTVTGVAAGSCTVQATKAGGNDFAPATATTTITVGQADQAPLTVVATPSTIVSGGTSTLSTPGGSGTGAVSFAVTAGTNVCSLSGSTVTGTASGSCTITATKAADANYNATAATRVITVTAASGADLQVAKSAPVTQAPSGSTVVYTIIVSNVGPAAANGATLAVAPVSALGNVVWQCVAAASTATCPSGAGGSGGGALSVSVNLPAGTHLRYDYSATLTAAVGSSVQSTATVAAPAGLTDPNPANNSSTHAVLLVNDGPIFRNGFEAPLPPIAPESAAAALRSALDL